MQLLCFLPLCAATVLRLVPSDGDEGSVGRLEISINDTWGTVFSSDFDIADADFACRQLSYESGAVAFSTAGSVE